MPYLRNIFVSELQWSSSLEITQFSPVVGILSSWPLMDMGYSQKE